MRDVFRNTRSRSATSAIADRVVKPREIGTHASSRRGEKDDICARGQTLAARTYAAELKPFMRTHYVHAGAGHYGVFSGSRWRSTSTDVRDMIQSFSDDLRVVIRRRPNSRGDEAKRAMNPPAAAPR